MAESRERDLVVACFGPSEPHTIFQGGAIEPKPTHAVRAQPRPHPAAREECNLTAASATPAGASPCSSRTPDHASSVGHRPESEEAVFRLCCFVFHTGAK